MKKMVLFSFLIFSLFFSKELFSYELGIVTMFRDEANYLKEWIEYHRMLGVDHFLLYNDRSQDNWSEVLEPYINSNLVEVISWDKNESTPLFPVWQIMAYKDGLRRSEGNTKWLAFIDIDEFILPKKNKTILECLNQYFPSASGVYICWRNFGTGGVYLAPDEPILTQLTSCSDPFHPSNASGKSIVKVDEVLIDQIWFPHHLVLKEGGQYYNGSGEPLYFNGGDLQVSPTHTSDFFQVNHYPMRDENYYKNVRLSKAISIDYNNLALVLENYQSFNSTHDYQIIEFLKTEHPTMYYNFWMDSISFYSQAAQDKFVYTLLYELLGKQDKGYYLEIGAAEPININNSYFFEKHLQWIGISIDNSDNFQKDWSVFRTNPLLTEDAIQANYSKILQNFPREIDYLSLDIDGYYDVVLQKMPFNDHIFKVITIEHDFYRFGEIYRKKEREILEAQGYYLLCANVMHDGFAFEDWWIHPSAFPPNVLSALISLDLQEKECTQLIEIIQTLRG